MYMTQNKYQIIMCWPLITCSRRRTLINTKPYIYIALVISLLIAWHYRVDFKDIKDGLVSKIHKAAKRSPYTDDNLEHLVIQTHR